MTEDQVIRKSSEEIGKGMYPNNPGSVRRLIRELHTENVKTSFERFRSQLHVIDLSISILLDFFLISHDRPEVGEVAFWPSIANRIPSPDLLCQCAVSGVVDMALAARELSIRGLDNPARLVIRSIFELGDFILSVMGDPKFFEDFAALPQSGMTPHQQWSSLLKPSHLRKKAAEVIRGIGASDELVAGYIDDRASHYQKLSQSAHLDFEGLICGNLRRYSDDESNVAPSILGVIGPSTGGTLGMLADEIGVTTRAIAKLLIEKHGWEKHLTGRQLKSFKRQDRLMRALTRMWRAEKRT